MIQDHCAGTDSSATGTLTPQQSQITQAKDNCCKHYGCRGSDTLTPYSGAIFPTIIHKLPLQQSKKLQMTYLVHPKKLFLMVLILISLIYINESLKESIHAVFVSLPIASRESVSIYRFVHYISFYHLKTYSVLMTGSCGRFLCVSGYGARGNGHVLFPLSFSPSSHTLL